MGGVADICSRESFRHAAEFIEFRCQCSAQLAFFSRHRRLCTISGFVLLVEQTNGSFNFTELLDFFLDTAENGDLKKTLRRCQLHSQLPFCLIDFPMWPSPSGNHRCGGASSFPS